MSSVHDAIPGDIYVDDNGKLWRVVWTQSSPTVSMEEVETAGSPSRRRTASGGVNGYMWNGFKRIWRRPEMEQEDQA